VDLLQQDKFSEIFFYRVCNPWGSSFSYSCS